MKNNISIHSLPARSFTPATEKGKEERFSFQQLKKGRTLGAGKSSAFRLLFLLQGAGTVRSASDDLLHLEEGECILMNLAETSFFAREESLLLLWNPETGLYPTDRTFFHSLHPEVIASSYILTAFPVRPAIKDFLHLFKGYLEDGRIESETLYELKQRELLLLFRHYYNRLELARLFHPLVCRMEAFREKVLEAAPQVKSSGELMKVVGMKRTSFERKFRRHFGTSVHQWILRQKAFAVRKSLEDPTLSLEEIRKRHGFNSATHFVRFCRTQFGLTPTQMRRRTPFHPPKGGI